MSQDQKPARVRVVKGSGGDAVAAAPAGDVAAVTASKPGALPAGKARGGLLPVALFLIGCAGGGVAVSRFVS